MTHPQVVRVYATYQDPDYECPWQSVAPRGSTGSGVIIGPQLVLTGAHVVANATFVQVQKQSDPAKVTARVVTVSHDCDLALLHIEDKAFARGVRPAVIGDLPRLRDAVQVVGYPIGGEEVSITEGVVSRIEVQRYEHSQRHLLAVTVDAAINEGNSGGPVFARGKVVGIAFQAIPDAENIGEMVPAPIIRRFLAAARHGLDPAVPGIGITTQPLENPALRRHLDMGKHDSGVLITAVQYGSSAWGMLEVGDVLMELDGLRIADNGTVRYRGRHRCQFDAVIGDHHVGDRVRARMLRRGKPVTVTMVMQPMAWLVPRTEYDRRPMWFLFGGLVFQRLTAEFLRNWGEHWWDKAPKELLHLLYSGLRRPEQQEVVVLAQVLADAVNVGYEAFHNDVVVSINGTAPVDMRDFVRRLDAATGEVVFKLSSGATVLLDAEEARAAMPRILTRYHVPGDRSADLARRSLAKKKKPAPKKKAKR
ncbi:MAG: trypsin-like peptidase domain-containing protein [Planctomycetes bacterium]|nr:trypsin-like peptidase domain-containing protein [Planctomycetota bacterium]MCC7399383.1 trypsin-like peptidase domain-containing protein [Planctomycetota bacterium]